MSKCIVCNSKDNVEIFCGNEGFVTDKVGKPLCSHHYNLELFKLMSQALAKEYKMLVKLEPIIKELCKDE